MELARMTTKGQLTIPIAIRRLLGVEAGDQVIFYEKDGQIVIAGADPASLQAAQIAAAENHVYTLNEIRRIAAPVAETHGVDQLRLFGSYARGEATPKSDLDFVISRGEVSSLFKLAGLQTALADAFHKKVDILTDDSLEPDFKAAIQADEVKIYERQRA